MSGVYRMSGVRGRRDIDWSAVDWSRTDGALAEEYSKRIPIIRGKRRVFAPDQYRLSGESGEPVAWAAEFRCQVKGCSLRKICEHGQRKEGRKQFGDLSAVGQCRDHVALAGMIPTPLQGLEPPRPRSLRVHERAYFNRGELGE